MKPPLLLIGHGTHDETGVAEFGRFVHRLRCRLDGLPAEVSGGFITNARPPLADSIASLVARGHHHLIAVPLSLTGDRNALGDVPGTMALEQERHPTLEYDLGRSLGPDPRVLRLLAERLADARAEMPRFVTEEPPVEIAPNETAVVLVGHGSTDPAVNAEVHRVSRLFWETHVPDLLTVETAYVSHARPGVPGGLERCRRLGAKRVIVLPYVLFAGAVLERIWAQALAYGANHEGLDIRCAEVIGDCEGLADVVIDRYEEALAGAGVSSAPARVRPRPAVREIRTGVPVSPREAVPDLDGGLDVDPGLEADLEAVEAEIETEMEAKLDNGPGGVGTGPLAQPGVPSAV
ncbi:sirohydrochlorin chelatase [Microbispora sp. ATCC PTA-5024]|uniref:sirohydrochlorin chelatase n=1 Tax=Microbispora sp. ATCC PTA-5024 TaxID=316330 RepID=UPI0003DDA939|nr:sirohydrochlorin chelatase [Microbispora sp. ATCC PTA-5024]ETK31328.1 membrane protein [Microbispora sp. ATCC PTA-5024]